MATLEEKQAVWFEKLKTWLPQWWFELEDNNVAVFQGMALVLARLECTLAEHVAETFICNAKGGFLDEHGAERNVVRAALEVDLPYSNRIKNIVNTTSCPQIKALVDALLDVGESTILEDFNGGVFFSRDSYFNRGEILINEIYNTFSIVVDNQVHAPYSFYDREHFLDREDFLGTNESSQALFERVVEAVNSSKALGTLYRLIERLE